MSPRTPFYGQQPPMPGKKKGRRMLADGDMSSPSELDTPPTGGSQIPQPDNDSDDMPTPQMTPEMLDYHTGDENCGACMYMGDDGTCAVLEMPVGETDWCKAFTPHAGGGTPGGTEGANPEMQPS